MQREPHKPQSRLDRFDRICFSIVLWSAPLLITAIGLIIVVLTGVVIGQC